MVNSFGDYLAQLGKTQLRIAETEKYAHVTFFFNGGVESEFPGEDRILVPSPNVATYDLQPEMSAPEVTDKLVEAIKSGKYDAIICNYANCDMVRSEEHTSELQSRGHLVCRLLLEKKKKKKTTDYVRMSYKVIYKHEQRQIIKTHLKT